MLQKLHELKDNALQSLEKVSDSEELDGWRIGHLGRKSELNSILRNVGQLPPEERPAVGRLANQVRLALEAACDDRTEALKRQELERALREERSDVTLPGRPASLGRLHLSTQTLREIYAVFGAMGFQVYESPDVETDELNFGLLNMPPHHPARDMWDTFWISDELLLRTHTSPGQIRVMREH